jgi:hypothetical protein
MISYPIMYSLFIRSSLIGVILSYLYNYLRGLHNLSLMVWQTNIAALSHNFRVYAMDS